MRTPERIDPGANRRIKGLGLVAAYGMAAMVGFPLGLALAPIVARAPILACLAAALAMVIYAVALPGRYDVACGAYAWDPAHADVCFGDAGEGR